MVPAIRQGKAWQAMPAECLPLGRKVRAPLRLDNQSAVVPLDRSGNCAGITASKEFHSVDLLPSSARSHCTLDSHLETARKNISRYHLRLRLVLPMLISSKMTNPRSALGAWAAGTGGALKPGTRHMSSAPCAMSDQLGIN